MIYDAAVIGCGRIGCSFDDDPNRVFVSTHAGAYAKVSGVELVALADIDEQKLAEWGNKLKVSSTYTDFKMMLKDKQPDIVSVCTSDDSHLDVAIAVAESGAKAVFCEKPIAETLSAAKTIIDVCAANDVLLMVNHKRRFSPFFQAVAKFLSEGHLGEIQHVNVFYVAGLANTCSHIFDLLRFFFGEITCVQGWESRSPSPYPQDPNVDGWLWFEKNFSATLQACDVSSYYILDITILGSTGRLRVKTGTHDDIEYEALGPSPHASEYNELLSAKSPFPAYLHPDKGIMIATVSHLLECLDDSKQPICNGKDGLKSLEIICAFRESLARDGARVELPLQSCDSTKLSG